MTNIISFDPGGTTGIAFYLNHSYETLTASSQEEILKLFYGKELWSNVVCENFIASGRISKNGLYTVRMIGFIQALCMINEIPLTLQTPQKRLAYLKETTKLGLTFYVDHQRDALAHLLKFQADNKEV